MLRHPHDPAFSQELEGSVSLLTGSVTNAQRRIYLFVYSMLCRKGRGVALSPARDSVSEVPDVPQPGSAEFTTSPYAQLHAHLLPLLTPDAPEVWSSRKGIVSSPDIVPPSGDTVILEWGSSCST